VHRAIYQLSRGTIGLRRPRPDRWGMMCLTTTGRRTGTERHVILAYFEDGRNIITMAMNGWAEGEPAWWLNVKTNPDAIVHVPGRRCAVRARAAAGEERERLWSKWREVGDDVDAYAKLRPTETTVVVLEPRPE
ncbi:nitroreductase family deazaflavin-dependent oxidoreductase, partial [Hoyosella sp. YIM 151337]|uniref:nitroreductase family deazaflavin-dependent oxidoreductase n=1 Tax=Hoyosella sp. YIM 151337 TaxID=2992742 RepID=UPI0022364394